MSQPEKQTKSLDDLLPVPDFVARHPHIGSVSAIRDRVYRAPHNGLADAGAVVRMGRRVFINVPRFYDWLASGRAANG